MNFDFGEIVRRAWQITWKHKLLWSFGALPLTPLLFYLPLVFYLFLTEEAAARIAGLLNNPALIVLFVILLFVTAAVSLLLQVFSRSAITFEINQIEAGSGLPAFGEISRGGRLFFWRMLAVMLLAGLAITFVLAIFSACISVVGFATFGLGSLIGQLVLFPVSLLGYAVLEQSQVAVVADGLSPTQAVSRAWALVNKHLGLFIPLAFVLSAVLSLASSLVLLPAMGSLLLAIMSKSSAGLSHPALLWTGLSGLTMFVPLYLLFQAVASLFARAVHVVTYLRLKRSLQLQPLP